MMEMIAALALASAHQDGADPRLDLFRQACLPHRQDMAAAAQALARDGWDAVAEQDHAELSGTLARARAVAVDPDLQMENVFSVWGRTVDGRRYYVVLNRLTAVLAEAEDTDGDGILQEWEERDVLSLIGCGLWDFEADAAVNAEAVTAWVGAEPVQTVDLPGQIQAGTWNVHALYPGTGEIHVGFIPDGSPYVAETRFSGVSITMSTWLPEPTDAVE